MKFINNLSICCPHEVVYLFYVWKRSLAPFHSANSFPPQNVVEGWHSLIDLHYYSCDMPYVSLKNVTLILSPSKF